MTSSEAKFIRSNLTRSCSSSGAEELKASRVGISFKSCLRVAKDVKECNNGLKMKIESFGCLLLQER